MVSFFSVMDSSLFWYEKDGVFKITEMMSCNVESLAGDQFNVLEIFVIDKTR